jgi:predicted transcriptional regulator of viral defense system
VKSIQENTPESQQQAVEIFRRHGGVLRTMQAVRLGVHPRTLYAMRDNGTLEQLSRGLYRLADLPPLGTPDLVAVAKLVPSGVICLISALSLHELTTEIPHEIHVAIARGAETPRLEHPPLRVFRFSGAALSEGVETHDVDGCEVRVYSAAKTIADCFKFRNKLGIDVALEGLKRYLAGRNSSVDELMRFARVCRVETVMRPYVEALL